MSNRYDIHAPPQPWHKKINWLVLGLIIVGLIALAFFTGALQTALDKWNGTGEATAEE